MKKRGLTAILFVLLLLPVFLIGCSNPENVSGPPEPQPEPYTPVAIGNYTGTGVGVAEGFAKSQAYYLEHGSQGADITITVTMKDGWMTDVNIDGPDETPSAGGALITILEPKIKEYNTFDLANLIDGISGATITFNGVKAAGEKAIEQIKTTE